MGARDETKTELQAALTNPRQGAIQKYMDLAVGRRSWSALLAYEFMSFFAAPMPGALGYAIRSFLYRRWLGSVGRGVVFGRNVVLRHPHKIRIGDGTIIDDYCVLDAKGTSNRGITLGAGVILARNTILSCKDGDIEIGDNTNIAINCLIHSEREVRLGAGILVASYCYLIGGGTHDFERTDVPIIQQESIPSKGIEIGDGAWLAARVTVLDGVSIGPGAVIGAGSIVRDPLPANAVAVGTPARVLRIRASTPATPGPA